MIVNKTIIIDPRGYNFERSAHTCAVPSWCFTITHVTNTPVWTVGVLTHLIGFYTKAIIVTFVNIHITFGACPSSSTPTAQNLVTAFCTNSTITQFFTISAIMIIITFLKKKMIWRIIYSTPYFTYKRWVSRGRKFTRTCSSIVLQEMADRTGTTVWTIGIYAQVIVCTKVWSIFTALINICQRKKRRF